MDRHPIVSSPGPEGSITYLPDNVWCRISNRRFEEQWDKWMMVVKE